MHGYPALRHIDVAPCSIKMCADACDRRLLQCMVPKLGPGSLNSPLIEVFSSLAFFRVCVDWPAGHRMGNKRVRFADAEDDGDAELKRGLGPVQRSTLLPEPDAGVIRRPSTACLLFL